MTAVTLTVSISPGQSSEEVWVCNCASPGHPKQTGTPLVVTYMCHPANLSHIPFPTPGILPFLQLLTSHSTLPASTRSSYLSLLCTWPGHTSFEQIRGAVLGVAPRRGCQPCVTGCSVLAPKYLPVQESRGRCEKSSWQSVFTTTKHCKIFQILEIPPRLLLLN